MKYLVFLLVLCFSFSIEVNSSALINSSIISANLPSNVVTNNYNSNINLYNSTIYGLTSNILFKQSDSLGMVSKYYDFRYNTRDNDGMMFGVIGMDNPNSIQGGMYYYDDSNYNIYNWSRLVLSSYGASFGGNVNTWHGLVNSDAGIANKFLATYGLTDPTSTSIPFAWYNGSTELMRLDSTNKLNVSGTVSASALQVNGLSTLQSKVTTNYVLSFRNHAGTDVGGLYLDSFGKSRLILKDDSSVVKTDFNSNGNNYIGGGNVGIGTTAPSTKLEVAGTVSANSYVMRTASTGTGTALIIDANGNILPLTSALRFKKNVTDLQINSDVLYQLQPREFDYKKFDSEGNEIVEENAGHAIGFIAEEVNEVLPQAVNYDSNGEIYSLKNEAFIPLLVKEIQKLREEIEILKSKVN